MFYPYSYLINTLMQQIVLKQQVEDEGLLSV